MLHELLCSSFPVSEASGSERFCSVCIKVLLEVAADGKSASVAVSFISCPAVNEPFVLSKPIRLKVSDPLLDFPSSASFIKREACWVRFTQIATGIVKSTCRVRTRGKFYPGLFRTRNNQSNIRTFRARVLLSSKEACYVLSAYQSRKVYQQGIYQLSKQKHT